VILVAILVEIVVRSVGAAQTAKTPTGIVLDSGAYIDLAARLTRAGINPYTWDYGAMFSIDGANPNNFVYGAAGAARGTFPFPALGIWIGVLFQGLFSLNILQATVLAHMALVVLIFAMAPLSLKPWIVLPLLVGPDFVLATASGSIDIIWALFLVAMIATWQRRTLRGIFFGLALATSQGPWLLLPFLVVYIHHAVKQGARGHIVRFLGISALTFLLLNLPFIVLDPGAWVGGVIAPLNSAWAVGNSGLASLSRLGIVNLPESTYAILAIVVLIFLLWIYDRHHRALRNIVWLLPGVVWWVSSRGMTAYWIYGLFPLLAALATRGPAVPSPRRPRGSERLTLGVAVVVLCAMGVFVVASRTEPTFGVVINPPILTTNGVISGLNVTVVNRGDTPIQPHFTGQRINAENGSLEWFIKKGPTRIGPGEEADYALTAPGLATAPYLTDGLQLVVTDGARGLNNRMVSTIDADRSYLFPDSIPNPEYLFWENGGLTPSFWAWQSSPAVPPAVAFNRDEGHNGVVLRIGSSAAGLQRVSLSNWIIFPIMPFGLWVHPPAGRVAYGVEITDATHTLWVLFSQFVPQGVQDENHKIIHRPLPAGEWSLFQVDVPALYKESGWQPPPLRPTPFRNMNNAINPVNFTLLLVTDGPTEPVQGIFGPVVQDFRVKPQMLMAETLDNPAPYYVRLGNVYIEQRNYGRAKDAFQRALEFSPQDEDAIAGLRNLEQAQANGISK
jgi:hypothetical protein